MIEHFGGIYAITNTANGRQYVGSAVDTHQRWLTHLSGLRRDKHPNPKLQAAWRKYGEVAFTFTVLERVDDPTNLLEREQHYLDTMRPYYNICRTAGNKLGVPLPADAVEKMRAGLTGQKRSIETRQRQSQSLKGLKRTAEQRANMCAGQASIAPETRARMNAAVSAAHKGKPPSSACIEASRQAHLGKPRPADVREKIGAPQRGRKRPDLAGRVRTPEHCAKLSASLKARAPWAAINAYSEKCAKRRQNPSTEQPPLFP